jgi:hypothetical protein
MLARKPDQELGPRPTTEEIDEQRQTLSLHPSRSPGAAPSDRITTLSALITTACITVEHHCDNWTRQPTVIAFTARHLAGTNMRSDRAIGGPGEVDTDQLQSLWLQR